MIGSAGRGDAGAVPPALKIAVGCAPWRDLQGLDRMSRRNVLSHLLELDPRAGSADREWVASALRVMGGVRNCGCRPVITRFWYALNRFRRYKSSWSIVFWIGRPNKLSRSVSIRTESGRQISTSLPNSHTQQRSWNWW